MQANPFSNLEAVNPNESESLLGDWSECQRKAIVLALALRMRDMSQSDNQLDYQHELLTLSDIIVRVLTETPEALEDNRDLVLRGLDERQVQAFMLELEAER